MTVNGYKLKRKTETVIIKIFRTVFIVGICYLFLFPIFYVLTTAFQSPSAANDPTVIFIPKKFSLESIRVVWKIIDYAKSLWLTVRISVISTIGSLISCSLVGYGLARFEFKEKKLAVALVLLTIIVPAPAILSSNYLNFCFFTFGGILKIFGKASINLINTPWTFILPSLFASGLRAGLFTLIFYQFFKGMPKDLEEAAYIDGCGFLKTYIRVMFPLAGSAFITVLLFSFIWHWNDVYSSTMYFNQGTRPLMVRLNELNSLLANSDMIASDLSAYEMRSYIQAGALLASLPPLILFCFTQRFFTESIERTGIVG